MNDKNIQTVAMEEIWKQNTNGYIPVLLEIYNPDIKWEDDSLEQENMYLRVINDSNPVVYKGKKYIPARFEFTPPEEDGKTVGNASIQLSAIDTRVVQLLRSIELQCDMTVMAFFAKVQSSSGSIVYKFLPLENFHAKLNSSSYSRVSAQLQLSFKDVLRLNVPRDTATKNYLPSVNPDD